MKCAPWEVVRSYDFPETLHINLQEVREVSEELKSRVRRSLAPARRTNLADPLVTIGSWGHGRSSSYLLNGLLRQNIPWAVLGGKELDNIYSNTKDNPADDLSRKEALRAPEPVPAWLAKLIAPQKMRFNKARSEPPQSARMAKELYAGCGALSTAMLQAFPRGQYVRLSDLF